MKTFANIMKILTALAAIAGVIYVIATYGDKIVAWAKKLLPSCEPEVEVEVVTEAPAEEEAEEILAEEDAPIEEVIVEEAAPVAEDSDFEA